MHRIKMELLVHFHHSKYIINDQNKFGKCVKKFQILIKKVKKIK